MGAGTGRHSVYLAKQGFFVTALEQERQAITELGNKAAAAHVPIELIRDNIQDATVRGPFDVVLATMLLHFFVNNELHTIVEKMKALSKSGGFHVVSVLTTKNCISKRPHLFDQNELRHLYDDWYINEYYEGLGRPFRSGAKGKKMRQHIAALIAYKH